VHRLAETLGRGSASARRGRKSSLKQKRIIVTHYGGPDALQVLEEECPEPKLGEVRVKVLAAGVSLPDIMAREGIHPETPPVPFTPGWDLVGAVDRLGGGVSGIETGQIVANASWFRCPPDWMPPKRSASCLTTSPRTRCCIVPPR
jgi:NADPH:quinone reductase-like Zn-dependent oxidoreductase